MMRAPVLLLLVTYAACGLAVAGSSSTTALLHVVAALVPFLVFSAIVNDLADARIDAVNLPADARRVLVAGSAHRHHLAGVAAASLAVALVAASSLGTAAVAVLGAGLAISTAYSLGPVRLAERGMVASLTLPACYVAVPYLLGLLAGAGSVRPGQLLLLVALYVGFIGRIILKDFRDVRGDALFGKRTFLVRRGRRATCQVSGCCWALAGGLVILTTPQRTAAMAISTLACTGLALWLLHRLARDPGHREEERVITALAILGRGMLVILILPIAARNAAVPVVLADPLTMALAVVHAGLVRDMLRYGPRRGVVTPEPATRHTPSLVR
jgi:4-hydroxybenzoate polyprenyltransferase